MKKYVLLFIIPCFLFSQEQEKSNIEISGIIIGAMDSLVKFTFGENTIISNLKNNREFKASFLIDSAQYVNFHHGFESTKMYLNPGDDIYLTINPKWFDETVKYKSSPQSSYLSKKYLVEESSDFFGKNFYLKTFEEYDAFLNRSYIKILAQLGKIKDLKFVENEKLLIKDRKNYYKKQKEKFEENLTLNHQIISRNLRQYLWKKRKISQEYSSKYYQGLNIHPEKFQLIVNNHKREITAIFFGLDSNFLESEKLQLQKNINMWLERNSSTYNMPKKGDKAINFTYPNLQGDTISLFDFEGKYVYVDVWATWCGPCIYEIPHLVKLEEDYHNKDLVFVSISVDREQDKEKWKKMIQDKNLKGVHLFADGWSKITKDYAIFGIPRFMLFDRDGNVMEVNAPRPSSKEIRSLFNQILIN